MAHITPDDQAEIADLAGAIMHLVGDYCGRYPAALQQDVTDLLTRRISEASRARKAQFAAEETHSTDRTAKHHISDCSPAYCGRYQGQRRDSESPRGWWIATDRLARGGEKILGPFGTKELALDVRRYVEIVRKPLTFWVDQDAAPDAPEVAPLPGPMGTGLVNGDDTETLNFADESDYLDRP